MQRDRPRRTGLALRDPVAWRDAAQIVESAEGTGYEAIFLPEISGRETFATLAGLAGVTTSVRLANGVAAMGSRDATTTAMAAATVHELSGGRMVLGLGTGGSFAGALEGLRRYLATVQAALAGEEVRGRDGARFRLSLDPGHPTVPIWIAAVGPRAMRLAGEVADGALLNWCPPERIEFARERIREGAESAGRDPRSVEVGVYVRACLGQEEPIALRALRAAAGEYASFPSYRRQFEAVGLAEEASAAAAAHRAHDPEGVPEALVRAVCLLGDPHEAAARLEAYRDAGAGLPIVYPVPFREPVSSIMGTVFALAPSPAVES